MRLQWTDTLKTLGPHPRSAMQPLQDEAAVDTRKVGQMFNTPFGRKEGH